MTTRTKLSDFVEDLKNNVTVNLSWHLLHNSHHSITVQEIMANDFWREQYIHKVDVLTPSGNVIYSIKLARV